MKQIKSYGSVTDCNNKEQRLSLNDKHYKNSKNNFEVNHRHSLNQQQLLLNHHLNNTLAADSSGIDSGVGSDSPKTTSVATTAITTSENIPTTTKPLHGILKKKTNEKLTDNELENSISANIVSFLHIFI